MTVLALEQLHYSWILIHIISGTVRCSSQSGRSNSCLIRQNFKTDLPYSYDMVVSKVEGLDYLLFCILTIGSYKVKNMKGGKGTFMLPGKA